MYHIEFEVCVLVFRVLNCLDVRCLKRPPEAAAQTCLCQILVVAEPGAPQVSGRGFRGWCRILAVIPDLSDLGYTPFQLPVVACLPLPAFCQQPPPVSPSSPLHCSNHFSSCKIPSSSLLLPSLCRMSACSCIPYFCPSSSSLLLIIPRLGNTEQL